MTNSKIKWAMLGGGGDSLIGIVHRIAASMGNDYRLMGGVFSVDHQTSLLFAGELDLDPQRTYPDLDSLIATERTRPEAERIQLVTVATPNYLHYEMARKLILGGFHVICEKPVTLRAVEAEQLSALLKDRQQIFAVAHTYTGYPMVRQMRAMIAAGAIGRVHKIDAQYYQGWINEVIHDRAKRSQVWRLDPRQAGPSCCTMDIGVHAFNLVEYTTGLRVEQLLADIDTLYEDNPLDVDATVLVRLDRGARGLVRTSQIATAEENNLSLAVYGRTGALEWQQEKPNELLFLQDGLPRSVFTPGHAFNHPAARAATKLPPGHPEGLIDAMGNIYKDVAYAIRGVSRQPAEYPGIEAGVRGMRFVEAVLTSARGGGTWVSL